MEHEIEPEAYGLAAFALLEHILAELVEKGIFAKADLAKALHQIAQTRSARGVARASDVEIGAARVILRLANAL